MECDHSYSEAANGSSSEELLQPTFTDFTRIQASNMFLIH